MKDLRPAAPEDAEEMAAVHVAAWQTAYHGIVPDEILEQRDVAFRTSRLREFLSASEAETYVVERDDGIVGFMTLGQRRDEAEAGGEIWGIYLHPDVWRQGLGTAMTRFAEARLAKLGASDVTLWVLERNAAARAFYEAIGFEPDGASKLLTIGVKLVALRYRKALSVA